jgi:hypothetical protein
MHTGVPATPYTEPAAMTSLGAHRPLVDGLPGEIGAVARVVQGLLLHEHWAPSYGVTLTDEQRAGSQLRPVARLLDRVLALDPQPLATARPPERRVVGVCRHFALLSVALLRAHAVPARARCGFGAYFSAGRFEDHWVCERRDAAGRWVLADTQIDDVQHAALRPDFDLLDVPRDRFVIAGDAWARCRAGDADPARFGIFDLRGLWFVAGNVLRDAAALCGMEMLPWDVWGAMRGPDQPLDDATLAFVDRVAELTRDPDARGDELRALYAGDDRLRVPATVFNAALGRPEVV